MQANQLLNKNNNKIYSDKFDKLPRFLLKWYDTHARILPWRENTEPYRVWVSEIMLQQTRVSAVIPYYTRFMEQMPTITDLADANEVKLMKLWEGLGYYSRARNLQKAAKIICTQYNGKIPADYNLLTKLPGIGEYTAGAIASIAFAIPVPAVDGNVLRIFSRLTADLQDITSVNAKREYRKLLLSFIPDTKTGDFNQALMELGALICLPNAQPKCGECPLSSICKAHQQGCETNYPVKSAKKARKQQDITVLLVEQNNKILLCKRQNKGLLAGLWQYITINDAMSESDVFMWCKGHKITPLCIEKLPCAKHIFTHVQWNTQGYFIKTDSIKESFGDEHYWVDRNSVVNKYAIPSAFKCYTDYWLNSN